MAEARELASSITGTAYLGVQISKRLYHFGANTLGFEANHKINRIATNVTLYSSMLKQVASVMQDSSSLQSSQTVKTVIHIDRESALVFEEVDKLAHLPRAASGEHKGVAGGRKRSMSFARNVRLFFEQPKVDLLLAQLEYLKTTLSLVIQTLHLALVTAHAKETKQSFQEQHEQIKQERMHVETLIIARQLSIVIMEQLRQHQASATGEEDYGSHPGRFSPVDSEAAINMPSPESLNHESESGFRLAQRHGGYFDFLDTAMSNEEGVQSYTITRVHDAVIDELLARWTRLPEPQQLPVPNSPRFAEIGPKGGVQDLREYKGSADSERKVSSTYQTKPPGVTAFVDAMSETDDSDTETLVPSAPPSSKQGSTPLLAPPQHAAVHRGPARTPSPRLHCSQASASPTSANESRSFPSANAKAGSPRYTSASHSRKSSEAVPPLLTEDSRMYSSPRGLAPTSSMLQSPPTPASLPPPLVPPPGASSREPMSAQDQSGQAKRSPHIAPAAPAQRKSYQSRKSSGSSSSGSSTSSDNDYEIPWRIRIGSKYWDFLDDRLVGPKNPDLPTEPLSWLYHHDYANTEITDLWASEQAIVEKKYPYRRIPPTEAGEHDGEVRWQIYKALRFNEVEALVERTNELERHRTRHAPPSPTAGPGPATAQPPQHQQRRTSRTSRPLPPPSSQSNPYFPPQGQPSYSEIRPGPQPRPNSNSSHWQTYPGPPVPGSPLGPPGPPQQRPGPQQPPRTVSFGDALSTPSQPGARPTLRPGSMERSPRSSADFTPFQQQPPQPQPHTLRPGSIDRSPRSSADFTPFHQQQPPQPQPQPQQPLQQPPPNYWPPNQAPMTAQPPSQIPYTYPPGPGVAPPPSPYSPYVTAAGIPAYTSAPTQWAYPAAPQQRYPEYPPPAPAAPPTHDQRDLNPNPNANPIRYRESSKPRRSSSSSKSSSSSSNRSRSRSGHRTERSSHRRKDREKRHDSKDKGEEWRRKGKAGAVVTGTLGGIGGLAALLEGLDGL